MNLLYRVIRASCCRSTHHKLAMDALRHMRVTNRVKWQNLFLKNYETYLEGSKAPDTQFKDFRNHVLHVRDNHWGGAPAKAEQWYEATVEALRRQDWRIAVYDAGILSHYYTDPLQPFHTAQSKEENNIHRAAEWSIAQSYDEIHLLLERKFGYPDVEVPVGDDWVRQMVIAGAEASNPHYETLIQHYNFKRGVRNPPEGLDRTSREILAQLIGHASVGFARILDRALEEADVTPPTVEVGMQGFLNSLIIPIRWVTNKLQDADDRAQVEAMYAELQRTGSVEKTLPEDDRAVRDLYEKEVVRGERTDEQPPRHVRREPPSAIAQPTHRDEPTTRQQPNQRPERILNEEEPVRTPDERKATFKFPEQDREALFPRPMRHQPHDDDLGSSREQELEQRRVLFHQHIADRASAEQTDQRQAKPLRFYLERSSDVEDAPSIGPKTARRLQRIKIKTVADLLDADPDDASEKLDVRHITPQNIRDWQDQARLVCQIPRLRGHDAQILTACDVRTPRDVAISNPQRLLALVEPFAETAEGQRVIRSGNAPDLVEVTNWIRWAGKARPLEAA